MYTYGMCMYTQFNTVRCWHVEEAEATHTCIMYLIKHQYGIYMYTHPFQPKNECSSFRSTACRSLDSILLRRLEWVSFNSWWILLLFGFCFENSSCKDWMFLSYATISSSPCSEEEGLRTTGVACSAVIILDFVWWSVVTGSEVRCRFRLMYFCTVSWRIHMYISTYPKCTSKQPYPVFTVCWHFVLQLGIFFAQGLCNRSVLHRAARTYTKIKCSCLPQ